MNLHLVDDWVNLRWVAGWISARWITGWITGVDCWVVWVDCSVECRANEPVGWTAG